MNFVREDDSDGPPGRWQSNTVYWLLASGVPKRVVGLELERCPAGFYAVLILDAEATTRIGDHVLLHRFLNGALDEMAVRVVYVDF